MARVPTVVSVFVVLCCVDVVDVVAPATAPSNGPATGLSIRHPRPFRPSLPRAL
jgi:hypothetical protein